MVREGGLEPPRFYSLAPQTSVSTIPPSALFVVLLLLSQAFWRVKRYFLVFGCIVIGQVGWQNTSMGDSMILRVLCLGLVILFFANCSSWQKPSAERQVSAVGQCSSNLNFPALFNILENNQQRIVVELGDFAEKFKLSSGFTYKVFYRGSREDQKLNDQKEIKETLLKEDKSLERRTRVEIPVTQTGVYVFKISEPAGFFGEGKIIWNQKVFSIASAEHTLTREQQKSLAEQYAPVLSMHKDELYFPVSIEYLTNQVEPDAQLAREPFALKNSFTSKAKFSFEFSFSELNNVLPYYGHSESVLKSGLSSSTQSRLVSRYGKNHVTVYYSIFENTKDREIYLNYHFFYSYDPKNGTPDKPASAAHIFDRESMTVVLNKSFKPLHVFYGAHLPSQIMAELDAKGNLKKNDVGAIVNRWRTGRVYVPWDKVIKNAGRPVPAIALGSHGVYPRSGQYGVFLTEGTGTKVLPEPAGGDRLLYPEFARGVEKSATSYSYKLEDLGLDHVTSECENPHRLLAFSGSTVDVLGPSNATFPPYTDREEDYRSYGYPDPMFDMDVK